MKPEQAGSRGSDKWAILFLTAMCPFMATLDTNIVNVALPVMSEKLGVTSGMITWVASAYMIALTASILFFGRLGDLKGQTLVFQYGMLVFTLGSFLCSISRNFEFLLLSRVVQALGAGATMANSQGIITRTFPKSERGRALGINGAFVALGTLAGPPLGGLLVATAGWQSLFCINIPIGLSVFAAGFRIFPRMETLPGKMDIPGAVLFALFVVPFFIGLQNGQAMGFTDPLILSCFLIAAVSFLLFLQVQRRRQAPLLSLRIFRNKWFSISIFCAFISFVSISCYNILTPFYLQYILKMSPSLSGVMMTIFPLLLVLVSPVSGYLSDRVGSEPLTLAGLFVTFCGLCCMGFLSRGQSLPLLALYMILLSFGNGLFQSPNNSLVMSSVPPEQVGIGGSVNALVRTFGQTAGIAVSTALLYGGMSLKTGTTATDFVPGQEDAFLFGIRLAFLAAAAVCLPGLLMTAFRLYGRKREKAQTSA